MDIKNAKEELTRALLEAVSALVSVAGELGLSTNLPTDAYDIVWMEDLGGRSEARRQRRLGLDRFGVGKLFDQLAAYGLAVNPIRKLEKTCESMVMDESSAPDILPLNKRGDLAKLVVTTYLETAESLSAIPTVVAKVSEQFITDLASPTYGVKSVYLVEHLEAPGPFEVDTNVHFRPISMRDYEEYSAVEPDGRLGFDRPWLNSSDWICETLDVGPKSSWDTLNRHRDSLEQITGALGLSATGRATFILLAHYHDSPFFRSGVLRGGNPVHSSGTNGKIILDINGVKVFADNYRLVKRIFDDRAFQSLRLPFRRLRIAASRPENEDRLVDYVIGLERLLAPDTESLEVTYRFRLRGAALLPDSFGGVEDRITLMSKLYSLRSTIVHGRADPSDVTSTAPEAERALKAILLWFGRALTVASHEDIIRQLDKALVEGVSNWIPQPPKT